MNRAFNHLVALAIEQPGTAVGAELTISLGKYDPTGRGGKGRELVPASSRASFRHLAQRNVTPEPAR